MTPLFEQTFTVRYYELDHTGLVRPVALLNYLQDAAGDHARRLGVSVADLRQRGLTWVLSRVHMTVERLPHGGETVLVRSWPSMREGRFSCREFELFDQQGRQVAAATSSWAVLDLMTRRPVRLDDVLPDYPLRPQRAVHDDFASLPRLETAEREERFLARRSDLDVNRHVNNVVYVTWALETLPDQVADGFQLMELEVGYRAEAFAGDEVLARSARVEAEPGHCFVHQLVDGEGKELTRLRTRWQPLKQRFAPLGAG